MNANKFGIKGLVIAPPVIGRISIGKKVERNGKVLPEKDDHFTITSQIKSKGEWIEHPVQAELESQLPAPREGAEKKLRSIPVRVMFDDPSLNVRAEYTAFDKTNGRPICTGNGDKARRFVPAENKVEEVNCPGPEGCEYGAKNRCKPYGRLGLQVEGQKDDLAVMMFRTTGFNSIRTLMARLHYIHGLNNGKLAGFPLSLKIRAKTASLNRAIYYVDLEVREGVDLFAAVKASHEFHKAWEEAGMSREHFEEAARQGMANGMFEDSDEDGLNVVEEFYSFGEEGEVEDELQEGASQTQTPNKSKAATKSKLDSLVLSGPEGQSHETEVEGAVAVTITEVATSEVGDLNVSQLSLPPSIATATPQLADSMTAVVPG